jgi:hypothetical protein
MTTCNYVPIETSHIDPLSPYLEDIFDLHAVAGGIKEEIAYQVAHGIGINQRKRKNKWSPAYCLLQRLRLCRQEARH